MDAVEEPLNSLYGFCIDRLGQNSLEEGNRIRVTYACEVGAIVNQKLQTTRKP